MRSFAGLVFAAFLSVGVSAYDYVVTFENPTSKDYDLYYIGIVRQRDPHGSQPEPNIYCLHCQSLLDAQPSRVFF